jgi:glycosyltransferase involved in cell wall biosynthesis
MRFVIEALGLTAGGGRELTLNLLWHLAAHGEHEFVALLPGNPEYAALRGSNLRTIYREKAEGLVGRDRFLNREVPALCSEVDADALLCLGNFAPRRAPCPVAALVHHPYFVYEEPAAERRLTARERLIVGYGRRFCRTTLPKVHVIAQTETMRRRLMEYQPDPERVSVIPNAAFFLPDGPEGAAGRTSERDEREPFTFVYVTRYYAHKNLEIFLEALPALARMAARRFRLWITIAADQHPGARKFLEKLGKSPARELVVNLGPVPSAKLTEIYGAADALVMPTLLESYSRTYMEAMHFGLPIVTSDRDFARERCGEAAVYCDPLDADSVARAMARLMEDAELPARLAEKGRWMLAEAPGWEEIAGRFVEVLERVARGKQVAEAQAALVG